MVEYISTYREATDILGMGGGSTSRNGSNIFTFLSQNTHATTSPIMQTQHSGK